MIEIDAGTDVGGNDGSDGTHSLGPGASYDNSAGGRCEITACTALGTNRVV